MVEVDACFMKIADNPNNPKDLITPFLFLRCHSSWRASCATATAGQVVETFVLLCSALEYAVYALFIYNTQGTAELWLKRNDDAATNKRMRDTFTMANIRPVIKACDKRLGSLFDQLYEQSIDLGGHPNP
jgi:hypothetical protein